MIELMYGFITNMTSYDLTKENEEKAKRFSDSFAFDMGSSGSAALSTWLQADFYIHILP